MYHSQFKRIYNRNKKETYIYIASELKDSYIRGDKLIVGNRDSSYTIPIKEFQKNLSLRTLRSGTIPMMYKILDGVDGSPTQSRTIIRVPWAWNVGRFQEEVLKYWNRNPSVEMVSSCHSSESVDMDKTFLTKEWSGDKSIRLADTEKRPKR